MNAKFGWWAIIGIASAFATAIGWQFIAAGALRGELEQGESEARALAGIRTNHERLLSNQPPAGELERLIAETAALPTTRDEVAALREQLGRNARTDVEKNSPPAERFAVGQTRAVAECRNLGTATPQAVLETALWAGAGGDVEAFAKTMKFINSQARQAAQALMESLPKATRVQYDSPERLIAFLTMRDVPLGSVEVRQFAPLDSWGAPAAQMQVMLRAADGKAKDTTLLFMNPGDGWKLVVTEDVVAKYAAMLKEPKDATGGK